MGSIVYLVRHGQATVTRFNYDNLSERGKEQARVLGRSLRTRVEVVDRVEYGTMNRHAQTLESLRSKFFLLADEYRNTDWNEYDHLDIIQRFNPYYQNRWVMLADMLRKLNPRRDFELMFDKAVERWQSGLYDDDYNESWAEYKSRTYSAFTRLFDQLEQGQSALVITSGGVIASITQRMLDLPDRYFMRFNKKIVNCSVTKFVRNERGMFLSTLNDHSAFEHKQQLITYI